MLAGESATKHLERIARDLLAPDNAYILACCDVARDQAEAALAQVAEAVRMLRLALEYRHLDVTTYNQIEEALYALVAAPGDQHASS